MIPPSQLPGLAADKRAATQKLFARIRKRVPKDLDSMMETLHEEVFAETDCLQCANCCKTTSPVFTDKDIERIAKHLRLRPSELVERHLHLDDEGDYVLNHAPCTFLGTDNYCAIYEVRPKACREYPHTDRKNFHQILPLTLKNTEICPAAYAIVERLKEELK